MSRPFREKLALDEARSIFGERTLRERAGTRTVYSVWKIRGVPWEIAGPLFMEQLSLASAAHTQLVRHGGPDMHAVLDCQGRVFELARHYGVDSKEFQTLHAFLTLYVPDSLTKGHAMNATPSDSAGPPRKVAALRRSRK